MPFRTLTASEIPLVKSWCMASRMSSVARLDDVWSEVGTQGYLHVDPAGVAQGALFFSRSTAIGCGTLVGFVVAPQARRHVALQLELEALDLAFFEKGHHQLHQDVLADDVLSIHRGRSLGFTVEGQFRDCGADGCADLKVTRMGILRKEWKSKRDEVESRLELLRSPSVSSQAYTIQILSDAGSWIASYVDQLVETWEAAGHTVRIAHQVQSATPADFCFCLSFSKLVPADVRRQFKHTLVVHESDLPEGRGWAPMTWQILSGADCIPVTLLEAVEAVDAGPIYLQEKIELTGAELNPEWRRLQGEATLRLCLKWVEAYPGVLAGARAQVGAGSAYPRRRPEDSRLDPAKTLAEQFNLLRVVDNERYPAFIEWRNRRYTVRIDPSK